MLFERDSGVLDAAACLRALSDTADFALHTGTRVTSLHQGDDAVRVATAGGHAFDADMIVDCAGPDALALLESPPSVGTSPSLPQVAYFAPAPGRDPRQRIPVFIEWGDDMIYGLPVPDGGPHGGTYKVSHHTAGTTLDHYDPVGTTPWDDDPELLALLTGAVRRLLPSLDPEPVQTERCLYDNSVDADFVIDSHRARRDRLWHERARVQVRAIARRAPGRSRGRNAPLRRPPPLRPEPARCPDRIRAGG